VKTYLNEHDIDVISMELRGVGEDSVQIVRDVVRINIGNFKLSICGSDTSSHVAFIIGTEFKIPIILIDPIMRKSIPPTGPCYILTRKCEEECQWPRDYLIGNYYFKMLVQEVNENVKRNNEIFNFILRCANKTWRGNKK
jgi:hypothetical protein